MGDIITIDSQLLTDDSGDKHQLKRRFHDNGDGTWSEQIYLGGGSSSGGSSGGGSVGGGQTTYSNLSNDFTATPNNGAKTITLSAFANTVLSSVLTSKHFASAVIKRVTSAGAVDTIPVTKVDYNNGTGVLTLADMTGNFAASDAVAVIVMGPDKAFDEANDFNKASLATRVAGEDLVNDRQVVEQRFNFFTSTTAATTTHKSGAGFLHEIIILGGTAGAITVYDNTAGSGTAILPTFTPGAVTPPVAIPVDASFGTGLTIVTAAATVLAVIAR